MTKEKKFEGQIIDNKYMLLKVLGSGSFAIVFLGTTHSGQKVAIKILRKKKEESLTRFYREIKVLQLLPKDPHVVQYIDSGHLSDGTPYMVLEYVEGESLRELLKRRRSLSPLEACEFMIQLCKAFVGLHKLGVVHRDVKPDNILVSKDNIIKLIDFGLIKDAQGILKLFEEEDIIESRVFIENIDRGVLAGTPEYMAPEQFKDSTTTDDSKVLTETSTDVFSLGIIFYQLITGKKPFPMRDVLPSEYTKELIRYVKWRLKLTDKDIPVITDLDPELWSIIRKALSTDPKERQRDALILMRDIDRYLTTGQGVDHFPESKTELVNVEDILQRQVTRIVQSSSIVGFNEPDTFSGINKFVNVMSYFGEIKDELVNTATEVDPWSAPTKVETPSSFQSKDDSFLDVQTVVDSSSIEQMIEEALVEFEDEVETVYDERIKEKKPLDDLFLEEEWGEKTIPKRKKEK